MPDMWQERAVGLAALPRSGTELSRWQLEKTLVLLHSQDLSVIMRVEHERLVGVTARAARARIIPAVIYESSRNLRYLAQSARLDRRVKLVGVEEHELWLVGIRLYGKVAVAECRFAQSGTAAWLVFGDDDSRRELVIFDAPAPSTRRRAELPAYTWDYMGDDAVGQAMAAVDRANFVRPEDADLAMENEALPIGHDQTISRPSTVAYMLRLLDLQSGMRVLDVGSGSGWTSALLAHLTDPEGSVVATELQPELLEFGRQNVARAGYTVEFRRAYAGGLLGAPGEGPFDRILVSAGASALPYELVDQLAPGGVMVIPIGYSLARVTLRRGNPEIAYLREPGFLFVPLL